MTLFSTRDFDDSDVTNGDDESNIRRQWNSVYLTNLMSSSSEMKGIEKNDYGFQQVANLNQICFAGFDSTPSKLSFCLFTFDGQCSQLP